MRILVTGAAGFIGFHVSLKLLERGHEVLGVDSLNEYYDPALKQARLGLLPVARDQGSGAAGFRFQKLDIADRDGMTALFSRAQPQRVVHLAAQPGVRYSLDHPHAYVDSNLVGFANVLEGCRNNGAGHLVFASSSSVYGLNQKLPFSVEDNVDHPVSLYGATKKANELMAHAYSHLFGLPVTGLRFFTVYGPWGRPDMAYFKFTKAILEGRPIEVYNHGNMQRDFTYIDDIVEGLVRVLDRPPTAAWEPNHTTKTQRHQEAGPEPRTGSTVTSASTDATAAKRTSACPYKLYNIGNHTPINLLDFIEVLEKVIGKKAVKNLLPMQPGDVLATFADVDDLTRDIGFAPSTPIEVGVRRFVTWFRDYYRV
jgi:UDP-glucuronate 4-epimerase